MQTVVRLAAKILQVREVDRRRRPSATAPSTGCSGPRASPPSRCGYADGFLRALSVSTGEAGPGRLHRRYPVPIVGRVSMDFITVDVTERAAELARARRLGRGDGRSASPSTISPTAPAPSATSCCRGWGQRVHASTRGPEPEMARTAARSQFVCQNCGASSSRWAGKCARLRRVEHASSRRRRAPPPGSGLGAAPQGPRASTLETLAAPRRRRCARLPTGLPSSTASPAAASCRARRC